jgi:hypothetical protein
MVSMLLFVSFPQMPPLFRVQGRYFDFCDFIGCMRFIAIGIIPATRFTLSLIIFCIGVVIKTPFTWG